MNRVDASRMTRKRDAATGAMRGLEVHLHREASHWFFRSDSMAVRSGFRMRHGPAQVSWPRLRPQRYGENARAGRPHNPC